MQHDARMIDVSLRKALWQLLHPLSTPPWTTEDDVERENMRWEDVPASNTSTIGFLGRASSGAGAAADTLEAHEAPPDPGP
jgi:hypothetical protein